MTSPGVVMVGSYDYRLVALSVLISMLAAYAALELAERMTTARTGARLPWLIGGAAAGGIGTWSMHYTGMLAFTLPVPVQYHWPTALLSCLPAAFGFAAALFVMSRRKIGWLRVLAGGTFVGGGIAAMHYTAMESMRLPGMCHYSPFLVTLSVVLAILFSVISLRLTFILRDAKAGRRLAKAASVLLMGSANPVMHYTGMAAATFTRSHVVPNASHVVSAYRIGVEGITIVPLMVLAVAWMTSLVDRLRKERALLDELFEQGPLAVLLTDAENRVIRVNREFARMFGYTSQETVGRRISELIVPDELQDEFRRYEELAGQGQRTDAESVRRRKDGGRLPVSIVRVPVALPGGQEAFYAIFQDITERKQAEKELREQRSRSQTYLDIAGVMLLVLDPNQEVVLINLKGCGILGYKREEIIGKNWCNNFVPARERDWLNLAFAKLVAGEIELIEYVENHVLRKTGEERLIAWHNTALRDESGKIVNTLSSGEDITERTRAEEALRESEQKFRQLAENISEVFWVADVTADRVLYVSAAYERVWGRTCQSLYQNRRSFLEAIHADDHDRIVAAYENQVYNQVPVNQEYRIVRPDGSLRWIWDRSFPVREDSGRVYRFVGVAEDVTERKRAEEALRESEVRFRAIFENAAIGIALVDVHGHPLESNAALQKMLGYTRFELAEKVFTEYTHPGDARADWDLFIELVEGKREHY